MQVRWILSTNRGYLVELPAEKRIEEMKGMSLLSWQNIALSILAIEPGMITAGLLEPIGRTRIKTAAAVKCPKHLHDVASCAPALYG